MRAAMSTWKFGCRSSIELDEREVFRRTADMGPDERRLRVTTDDPVEGGQDLVKGREASLGVIRIPPSRRPEVPVGMRRELLPPLVALVERVEEGDRVGHMDDDGQAQPRTGRPQRVEALVVDADDASVGVARAQAERLPGLQATGALPGRVLEAPRLHLAELGPLRPGVEGQAGEVDEARGMGCSVSGDALAESHALLDVEVEDRLHAGLVEGSQELRHRPRVPAHAEGGAQVVVRVDDAEAWSLHAMLAERAGADRAGSRPAAGRSWASMRRGAPGEPPLT